MMMREKEDRKKEGKKEKEGKKGKIEMALSLPHTFPFTLLSSARILLIIKALKEYLNKVFMHICGQVIWLLLEYCKYLCPQHSYRKSQ